MSSSPHRSSDQSERPVYDDSDHPAKNPSLESEAITHSSAASDKIWPKSRMGVSGTFLVLNTPDNAPTYVDMRLWDHIEKVPKPPLAALVDTVPDNVPIYLDIRLWDRIEVASKSPIATLMVTALVMLGICIPFFHDSLTAAIITAIFSLVGFGLVADLTIAMISLGAVGLAAKLGMMAYRCVRPNKLRLRAGELSTEMMVADGYQAVRSIVDTLAPHTREVNEDWRQVVDRIPTLMKQPAPNDPDSLKSLQPPLLWVGDQPICAAGNDLVINDVALDSSKIYENKKLLNHAIITPVGKIPVRLLVMAITARMQVQQNFPPVPGAWSHYALPPTPVPIEPTGDSEGYFRRLGRSLMAWRELADLVEWRGHGWSRLLSVLWAVFVLGSQEFGGIWLFFLISVVGSAGAKSEDDALYWTGTRSGCRLAVVGHFLLWSLPVAMWALLALGGYILCFIAFAHRPTTTTFPVRLGRALIKALGNSLGAVAVGMFLVCVAQFTLIFLITPRLETLAFWDAGLVSLQEWLRSTLYLSFPALFLILLSLVLASSLANGLSALSHFTRIRRWGARALVVTTTMASFTFFADSRLEPHRPEFEKIIEAQLLAQEHRDDQLRTSEERRVKKVVKEIEVRYRAIIANAIIQRKFQTYSPHEKTFLRDTIKHITTNDPNSTRTQKLFAERFATTMPKLPSGWDTAREAAATDGTRADHGSSSHFNGQTPPQDETKVDLASALSSVHQWTHESPHLSDRTQVTPEMIAAVEKENARLKQIDDDARQVTHHLFQTAVLQGMSGTVGQVFIDALISECDPFGRQKPVQPVADLASAQQWVENNELQDNRRRQVSWERIPESQAAVQAMALRVANTYTSEVREQVRREQNAARTNSTSGLGGGGRTPSSGGSSGGGSFGMCRSRRRQPVLLTA